MRPRYAVNDIVNLLFHYAISFCDFGLRDALRRKHPNFFDFGFGNFVTWMSFAGVAYSRASALLVHVCGIVLGFTQKQVIWILAAAHIALMADEQAIGDGAKVKHVGDSMGKKSPVWSADRRVASFGVNASLPQPAIIFARWRHMLPEQFFNGLSFGASFGIMGMHRNLSFRCQAWDGCRRCQALLIGATGVF